MKAFLYAVQDGAAWSWRFSAVLAVDLAYWCRRGGGEFPLVRLEPEISLGQAVAMAEALGRMRDELRAPERVMESLAVKWREMFPAIAAPEWKQAGMDKPLIEGVRQEMPDETEVEALTQGLAGRALLPEELKAMLDLSSPEDASADRMACLQAAFLWGRVTLGTAVVLLAKRRLWRATREYACRRCGSTGERLRFTDCANCGGPCPYCEECLGMGRARFCTLLVEGHAVDKMEMGKHAAVSPLNRKQGASAGVGAAADRSSLEKWGLSPAQTEASLAGLEFLRQTAGGGFTGDKHTAGNGGLPCFLVWAVTGAGKTEMMYPFVEEQLACGGNVLIATPRRDVVLELMPRLKAAFPERSVVTLYGGSEQRWEHGDITLATTHQLLRFSQAFDLAVIDELDAFPFHNNPVLEFAARKSVKQGGRCILLSATPPKRMQVMAKMGTLPHVKVPVRFHRHPLPVPALLRIKDTDRLIRARTLPAKLEQAIQASLDRGARLFVFVARISQVEPLAVLLRGLFPEKHVEGTSSQDEARSAKVTGFRRKEIDILVTTTILERGVTVPKADVFVLGADSGLFDQASLIQMAGRAGRSKEDPLGRVYFAAKEVTKAQADAIRQIRSMNRLACEKGYLIDEKEGIHV